MLTREYAGPDSDVSRFADGTWRQPAAFVRDMGEFHTTAMRLRRMRAEYPAKADAPKGWGYDRSGCVGDPAYWYGKECPATMTRGKDGARLCYGEGLGGRERRPLRFVGFVDKVSGSGVRHSGWYTDDLQMGLMRGVVFQIPGKDGAARYMAGVEWGESSRAGFDSGGGWIDCGRGSVYSDPVDAARVADSLAENAAREEREYQARAEEWAREEEEAAERREEEEEAERMAYAELPPVGAD